MRTALIGGLMSGALLALSAAGFAQPPERGDKAPPPAGDSRPPRGAPRPDDDAGPPPGKAGPQRGREGDAPPRGKKTGPRAGGDEGAGGMRMQMGENVRQFAERVLRQFDRNGNGKLDGNELESFRDPQRVDANGDGEITLPELIARLSGMEGGMFGGGFGGGGFGGYGRGGFGGEGGFGGGPGFGMPGPPFGGPMPPDDPEMRELLKQDTELDRQSHDVATAFRRARGEERDKLKAELVQLVGKHFEVRQKRRELQLKRMEEELKRLRDAIGERNESRESIIGNRLREMIGEARNLDF